MGGQPPVTLADLEPFGEMVVTYTDTVDTLSTEDAILAVRAIDAMTARLNDCRSLLVSQALRGLEADGHVTVDGTTYYRAPKVKTSTNHSKIEGFVVDRALVDPATGRKVTAASAKAAVQRAIGMMRDLYLAPSTTAKVGMLHRLGIDVDAVNGKEITGYQLGSERRTDG